MRRLEVDTVRGMIRARAMEERRAVKEDFPDIGKYELVFNILTVFALGILAGICMTATVIMEN